MLQKPVNLQVDWQHKMNFDGRKAVFEHSVVAPDPTHRLRTEVLEAQLQRPIRFADAKMDKMDQQIEEIYCHGGVFMEGYTLDDHAQLLLATRGIEVPDCVPSLLNGRLLAGGPGWVVVVRRGAADLLGDAAGTGPADQFSMALSPTNARGNATAKPPGDQLGGMQVRYQG